MKLEASCWGRSVATVPGASSSYTNNEETSHENDEDGVEIYNCTRKTMELSVDI